MYANTYMRRMSMRVVPGVELIKLTTDQYY